MAELISDGSTPYCSCGVVPLKMIGIHGKGEIQVVSRL